MNPKGNSNEPSGTVKLPVGDGSVTIKANGEGSSNVTDPLAGIPNGNDDNAGIPTPIITSPSGTGDANGAGASGAQTTAGSGMGTQSAGDGAGTSTGSDGNCEGSSTTQIDIDGTIYNLNESGDAIDESGTVIHTAAAIAAMAEDTGGNNSSDESDNDNPFADIAALSGINLVDETGQPLQFDWSAEGIANREIAVKRLGEREGFEKGFAQFLQNNPDVASIIDYKKRYNTIEGYTSHIDYTKMTLPENEQELYDLTYRAFIDKGESPDRAKRLTDFEKNDGNLANAGQASLEYFQNKQKAVEINKAKEREYEEKQRKAKEVSYYGVDFDEETPKVYDAPGSVYDVIVKRGEVAGMKIPMEGIRVKGANGETKLMSREEIFQYMAVPAVETEHGVMTLAERDLTDIFNHPEKYALAAINLLAGGLDQLIENKINSNNVKKLRSLAKGTKTGGGKGSATAKPNTKTGGNAPMPKLKLPVQG